MACAEYLIQIGNRESYGVLNLNRLIIRNPNGGTGIELGLFEDGGLTNRSYIIKIGEHAGTGALSKIRVSNICDKDGRYCKQVSELSTGSQITISGNTGAVCVKVDNNTLNCTGIVVNSNPTLSRSRTDTIGKVNGTALTVTMPANPHKTGKNIIGTTSAATANTTTTNTNTYLNHVEDSNVTSSLRIQGTSGISVSAQNGTLTISGTVGNTTTYTAGNGLSLASNEFKAKLKNETKSSYTSTGNIGSVSRSDRLYAVGMDVNGNLAVHVPRTDAGGDSLTLLSGLNNKYCKYVEQTSYKGGMTTTTTGIQCTYDVSAGGGDSLWITGTSVPTGPYTSYNIGNHIRPFNDNYNLYLSDNTTIYHGGTVKFGKAGLNAATSPVQFDANGARFGFMGENAYSGAGVGINGGMLVIGQNGCSNNKISIFASGDSQTANYEILGTSRLLVGVGGGSYIYIGNKDAVGINTTDVTNTTTSTLTVNGSIKAGNCGTTYCSAAIAGQIRYFEKDNEGYFVGCKRKNDETYRFNVNASNYARVNLYDGTVYTSVITENSDCGADVPYNSGNYVSLGMLAGPGQCVY